MRPYLQALIRKKVRIVDKDALVQVKVPYPLPLSWGRTVRPYEPPAPAQAEAERDESADGSTAMPCRRAIEEDSVLATDWTSIRRDFQVLQSTTLPVWLVVVA